MKICHAQLRLLLCRLFVSVPISLYSLHVTLRLFEPFLVRWESRDCQLLLHLVSVLTPEASQVLMATLP